jgi:hypothetical protein
MVEQQSSLQRQHFPAPFTIMTESLDSCEKSLQPLLYIVANFTAPQTPGSKVGQAWSTSEEIRWYRKARTTGNLQSSSIFLIGLHYYHISIPTNMKEICTDSGCKVKRLPGTVTKLAD